MHTKLLPGIVFASLAGLVLAEEPRNAPEKNRQSLAEILQTELSREVDGKKYASQEVEEKIKIKVLVFEEEVKATAQAKGEFLNPRKELLVQIPTLHNLGAEGLRLTSKVKAPVKLRLVAKAGPLSVEIDVKGQLEVALDAEVKLTPAENDRVTAAITITRWTGSLTGIDVGNGEANKILGPVLQLAAKKLIDENRQSLQDDANRALKRASEEGQLTFKF